MEPSVLSAYTSSHFFVLKALPCLDQSIRIYKVRHSIKSSENCPMKDQLQVVGYEGWSRHIMKR